MRSLARSITHTLSHSRARSHLSPVCTTHQTTILCEKKKFFNVETPIHYGLKVTLCMYTQNTIKISRVVLVNECPAHNGVLFVGAKLDFSFFNIKKVERLVEQPHMQTQIRASVTLQLPS